MAAIMWGCWIVLAAAGVLSVTSCGGDERRASSESSKTVTSEFLSKYVKRADREGTTEATTPGTGGFIETPQAKRPKRGRGREQVDELGEAIPEITYAPRSGEAVFKGVHREVYLRARAACARVPRRTLARRLRVSTTEPIVVAFAYAARHRPHAYQPALEGCTVGVLSR